MKKMNKKTKITKNQKKIQPYIPPRIQSFVLELEQGIAASSAKVNPGTSVEPVQEEWQTGTDRDGNLDW
jgi:hypothetical protein